MPRVAATVEQVQESLASLVKEKLGDAKVKIETSPVKVTVKNASEKKYKKVFGSKMVKENFTIEAKGKKLILTVGDETIEVVSDEHDEAKEISQAMKKLHLRVQKDSKDDKPKKASKAKATKSAKASKAKVSKSTKATKAKTSKASKAKATKAKTSKSAKTSDRKELLDELNDALYKAFGSETEITIDPDEDGKPVIGITLNNEIAGDSKERLLFADKGKLAWNDAPVDSEDDEVEYRYVTPVKGTLNETIYKLMMQIGKSKNTEDYDTSDTEEADESSKDEEDDDESSKDEEPEEEASNDEENPNAEETDTEDD